jgi:hypothetical protein
LRAYVAHRPPLEVVPSKIFLDPLAKPGSVEAACAEAINHKFAPGIEPPLIDEANSVADRIIPVVVLERRVQANGQSRETPASTHSRRQKRFVGVRTPTVLASPSDHAPGMSAEEHQHVSNRFVLHAAKASSHILKCGWVICRQFNRHHRTPFSLGTKGEDARSGASCRLLAAHGRTPRRIGCPEPRAESRGLHISWGQLDARSRRREVMGC